MGGGDFHGRVTPSASFSVIICSLPIAVFSPCASSSSSSVSTAVAIVALAIRPFAADAFVMEYCGRVNCTRRGGGGAITDGVHVSITLNQKRGARNIARRIQYRHMFHT